MPNKKGGTLIKITTRRKKVGMLCASIISRNLTEMQREQKHGSRDKERGKVIDGDGEMVF